MSQKDTEPDKIPTVAECFYHFTGVTHNGEHSSIGGERSKTAERGGRHVEVMILGEFYDTFFTKGRHLDEFAQRSKVPGSDCFGNSIFSLPQTKEHKHALNAQIVREFDTLDKLTEELAE